MNLEAFLLHRCVLTFTFCFFRDGFSERFTEGRCATVRMQTKPPLFQESKYYKRPLTDLHVLPCPVNQNMKLLKAVLPFATDGNDPKSRLKELFVVLMYHFTYNAG